MRIENIDFKQKTIFNPFGKTKAARRTIPMTDRCHFPTKDRVKRATANGTPFDFRPVQNAEADRQREKGAQSRRRSEPRSNDISGYTICATLRHTSSSIRRRSADAQRLARPHDHSDDNAVRSPRRGAETNSESRSLKSSEQRESSTQRCRDAAKSRGHYKSHYSGASELMQTIRKSLKGVARPERLERPTLCFEGRCSIQLSYGRIFIGL